MESTGGRQRKKEGDEWLGQTMLFVDDQVVLSFSLFFLFSRSMEMDMVMVMEGIEMDDALPQKR